MYWGTESQRSNKIALSENKLNWNHHRDPICSKANRSLGFLRRVLHYRCEIESLYCNLVRQRLEYASSARNPDVKRNINKTEMVQQKAARFFLHGYSILSRVTPMINQIGWDTLEQRRLLSQLTKFYKIQQGLCLCLSFLFD